MTYAALALNKEPGLVFRSHIFVRFPKACSPLKSQLIITGYHTIKIFPLFFKTELYSRENLTHKGRSVW